MSLPLDSRFLLFHHENSITVSIDTPQGRRYINVPTVVGTGKKKRKLSAPEAVHRQMQGGYHGPMFKELEDALAVAGKRSRNTPKPRRPRDRGPGGQF